MFPGCDLNVSLWEWWCSQSSYQFFTLISQGRKYHVVEMMMYWIKRYLTAAVHWMTSLQASFPAFSLKSSPALLSWHNFFSWESSSSLSWHETPDTTRTTARFRNHPISTCCLYDDPAALQGRLSKGDVKSWLVGVVWIVLGGTLCHCTRIVG